MQAPDHAEPSDDSHVDVVGAGITPLSKVNDSFTFSLSASYNCWKHANTHHVIFYYRHFFEISHALELAFEVEIKVAFYVVISLIMSVKIIFQIDLQSGALKFDQQGWSR